MAERYTTISNLKNRQNGLFYSASIRARVTIKSIRHDNDNVIYFYMDLEDDTGAISAAAFNEACDKFFNCIEESHTYKFEKFVLRNASPYTSIDHDKELYLEMSSTVEELDMPIEMTHYEFMPLREVVETNEQFFNVIGLWWDAEPVQRVFGEHGTVKRLRDLKIRDNSCTEIGLKVWNKETDLFEDGNQMRPVVFIKDARILMYNGIRYITSTRYVQLLDINDPRAAALQELAAN